MLGPYTGTTAPLRVFLVEDGEAVRAGGPYRSPARANPAATAA